VSDVTVTAADGTTSSGWLTTAFIPLASDVGGWTVAARDADIGVPEWTGTDPERWSFTLRYDSFIANTDIRPEISALLNMGKGEANSPPGEVKITGNAPAQVRQKNWLIEKAEPLAQGLVDSTSGQLRRMDVAIVLLRPEQADVISAPAIAKKPRGKSSKSVKAGKSESLLQLLLRVNKTTAGWQDVAALNGIRDPDAKLKSGQSIRLS
jgi:hypothetical protein